MQCIIESGLMLLTQDFITFPMMKCCYVNFLLLFFKMFSPTPFNTLHIVSYSLHHPRFVAVSFPHLDCRIIGHSSAQICFSSARLDGECRWTAISGLTADFQLDSSLGSGCAASEYQPSLFKPFFIVFAVCFESLSRWKMNLNSEHSFQADFCP